MGNKIHKDICWGIIGVGDVCEVKSGPALMQIPHSSIGAVMRRDAAKAKDFAMRHGVDRWYDDAEDLLNDPEINAIYIATPPDSHKEYTLRAAATGRPVYVEKPMARTYAECSAMVQACEEARVPLYVAYYRRALPNILKVKQLLEEGAIGELRSANIDLHMPMRLEGVKADNHPDNWRVNPEIAGGGYFYDLASHQLDALDFLLGPIVEAHGFSSNQSRAYEADDITLGVFKFDSGVLGRGTWAFNTSTKSKKELITILGSKGEISFPCFGDHHVSLKREGRADEKFTFDISRHIQRPLIETIVDDLRGKGCCDSTGTSALRTNWVMEQIVGSRD